jgi:hypothetical protein
MGPVAWDKYVDTDTDTMLNRIDEQIEEGDFADRLEGFIDHLEQRGVVARSEVKRLAIMLLDYAEARE